MFTVRKINNFRILYTYVYTNPLGFHFNEKNGQKHGIKSCSGGIRTQTYYVLTAYCLEEADTLPTKLYTYYKL